MPAPSTTKNMKMPCAHNWSRVIHSPAAITAIRIAMLVTDLFKEGGPDAEKLVQGKSSGSMIASRPCSVMTVPLSPLKRISDGMPDTLNRCCSAFTLLSPCGVLLVYKFPVRRRKERRKRKRLSCEIKRERERERGEREEKERT